MSLKSGDRLGPYEIIAPIGAGGMGAVYRARDPRIERDVTIKVLSGELSRDSERLARFEREARAAGRLNHPNILVRLHGRGSGLPHRHLQSRHRSLRDARGPAPVSSGHIGSDDERHSEGRRATDLLL